MRHSWLLAGVAVGLWACGGRTLPLDDKRVVEPVGGVGEGGAGGASGTAGKGGTAGKAGAAGQGGTAGKAGSSGAGPTTGGVGGSVPPTTEGGGTFSLGEGGFSGVGGSVPSMGGAPPTSTCSSCVFSSLNDGNCQKPAQKCAETKGCQEYGQCVFEANCLDAADPGDCADKAGCQANQKARQAYRQTVRCLVCEGGCDEESCSVPPGYCDQQGTQGGPQGTGGGPGQGAGGSGNPEQECEACQTNVAPAACQDSVSTCFGNTACSDLINCGNQCGEDNDCFNTCFQKAPPTGQKLYLDILACYYCDSAVCGSVCEPVAGDFCLQIGGG